MKQNRRVHQWHRNYVSRLLLQKMLMIMSDNTNVRCYWEFILYVSRHENEKYGLKVFDPLCNSCYCPTVLSFSLTVVSVSRGFSMCSGFVLKQKQAKVLLILNWLRVQVNSKEKLWYSAMEKYLPPFHTSMFRIIKEILTLAKDNQSKYEIHVLKNDFVY